MGKPSNEYQAARRAARIEWLSQIKIDAGCADCGYNKAGEALDFDHVRGKKLFQVAQEARTSLKRLLAEIAKCDIVCANCHRIRTKRRRKT